MTGWLVVNSFINSSKFQKLYEMLVNSFSKYDGNTLRDKVVSWVLSLGFSIDTINEFRQIIINGTPETLTVDIAIEN